MTKLKIYNVWHNKIFDDIVHIPQSQYHELVWFGVNEKYPKEYNDSRGYHVIMENSLQHYRPELQKQGFCQTSCMYHCFMNKLYDDVEYVGFLQYDCLIRNTFIDDIKAKIADCESEGRIPIFYMSLYDLQKTLVWCDGLTDSHPNAALASYNRFFGTSHTQEEILQSNVMLPYNHCFVVSKYMFDKMMEWIVVYMNEIESSGVWPSRFPPAEFFERVHGLFFALEQLRDPRVELCNMNIEHCQFLKPYIVDKTGGWNADFVNS